MVQLVKNHLQCRRPGFNPWVGKMPWRREKLPTPVFWPGEFHGLYSPGNSPGQKTGVGRLSLLQGIFPTQGANLGLLHCRWILYQLSHKGSPRILEWIAYFLLQWIFPTQESNQGLLHCSQILYQLSYQGSFLGRKDNLPFSSVKGKTTTTTTKANF